MDERAVRLRLGPIGSFAGIWMKLVFRKIAPKHFTAIHDLALKGWLFAYKHLPKKELEKLVDRYYSARALSRDWKNAHAKRAFFVLAFEKKKLVGFCHVALRGKRGELFKLYIEPRLIGKGMGKKLLKRGERFLRAHRAKKYFTFVNRHNRTGIDFYLRNGFQRIPENDKDDEFGRKALWYIEKETPRIA